MDEILRDCLVSIAAIGAIFVILYVVLMSRFKERMALMEKGLSPKDFNNKHAVQSVTLRFGLLLIGTSIGIMLGNFVASHTDVPRQGAFIAMMFLFGGLGLIGSYLIESRNNNHKI
jgi:hypothetical protein